MISFFFFKQKTAYEMRISDWSSDVCSSDLNGCFVQLACLEHLADIARPAPGNHDQAFAPHQPLAPHFRARLGLVVEPGARQDFAQSQIDRKSTRLNSSHKCEARMPSSAGQKKHHTKAQTLT